jgi:TetR/AcrR family transcriptional regulator
MMEQDINSEKLILNAAKEVFLEKGFDGARMQEIADKAGINKALLHYYFRSKDKLFDAIFSEAFEQFLPKVAEIIMTDKPFLEKLDFFIDTYIDMLFRNPHLPVFVMHEISRNPERLISLFKSSGLKPEYLGNLIQKEVDAGIIEAVSPVHLIVNILGMCIFPFMGRPIIQGIIFNNDAEGYEQFLLERKEEIKKFVINSIRKK